MSQGRVAGSGFIAQTYRMRWLLVVVAVCGCDAGQPPSRGPRADEIVQAELAKRPLPPPAPPTPVQPVAPQPVKGQDELDAVARAVLERYVAKPDTVPDAGLIAGKPQYLKGNLGYPCQPDWEGCVEDHRIFTSAALPSPKFQLRTLDQLQAEAKRTNEFVHYIDITGVEIKGSEATLTVGVDFVMPDSGGKLCCCSATQIWAKQNGHWQYKKTTSTICS